MKTTITTRRAALAMGATAAAAGFVGRARAQSPAEVKVAVLAPMSGPWARQGLLMKMGAEMALDDINAAGGVKALGGAKMKLVVYDAGESTEKAKNAAQRMVAQEPDLVGGSGAWLSSFTLAVTEVTERAELPWLTLSYADSITSRGFKYVFQCAPTADAQAISALPTIMGLAERATGRKPTKMGIVADNTASPTSFFAPIRATEAKKFGLSIVVDEIFTPPLSDATSIIQRVRGARPDFLMMMPTNIPDGKILFDKLNEYGLGRGKLPIIGGGGNTATPELLNVVGKDIIQGFMSVIANWPGKQHQDLARRFMERTKEAWMGQDSIMTYADMMILKEGMEKAGSADRRKVNAAIHGFDLKNEGPAQYFPSGHLKFDAAGRLEDAQLVLIQWQDGVPRAVSPASLASAEAIWPKT